MVTSTLAEQLAKLDQVESQTYAEFNTVLNPYDPSVTLSKQFEVNPERMYELLSLQIKIKEQRDLRLKLTQELLSAKPSERKVFWEKYSQNKDAQLIFEDFISRIVDGVDENTSPEALLGIQADVLNLMAFNAGTEIIMKINLNMEGRALSIIEDQDYVCAMKGEQRKFFHEQVEEQEDKEKILNYAGDDFDELKALYKKGKHQKGDVAELTGLNILVPKPDPSALLLNVAKDAQGKAIISVTPPYRAFYHELCHAHRDLKGANKRYFNIPKKYRNLYSKNAEELWAINLGKSSEATLSKEDGIPGRITHSGFSMFAHNGKIVSTKDQAKVARTDTKISQTLLNAKAMLGEKDFSNIVDNNEDPYDSILLQIDNPAQAVIEQPSFRNSCFRISFGGGQLIEADFTNVKMIHSVISETKFSGGNFTNANFTHLQASAAKFDECIFANSTFINSTFNSITLNSCNFPNSNFANAKFRMSNIENCNMEKVNFSGASFLETKFTNVRLTGANLNGVDLHSVKFLGKVDLSGADLRGANLSGVDLSGVNLQGADLRGAILVGAIMQKTNLSGAKLDGAITAQAQVVAGSVINNLDSAIIVDDGDNKFSKAIKANYLMKGKEQGKGKQYVIEYQNKLNESEAPIRYTNTANIDIIHVTIPDLGLKTNLKKEVKEPTEDAKKKLFQAYYQAFEQAGQLKKEPIKPLNCPLMGIGVYKWPVEISAKIAGQAIQAYRLVYGPELPISIYVQEGALKKGQTFDNIHDIVIKGTQAQIGLEIEAINAPLKLSEIPDILLDNIVEAINSITQERLLKEYKNIVAMGNPKIPEDANPFLAEMSKAFHDLYEGYATKTINRNQMITQAYSLVYVLKDLYPKRVVTDPNQPTAAYIKLCQIYLDKFGSEMDHNVIKRLRTNKENMFAIAKELLGPEVHATILAQQRQSSRKLPVIYRSLTNKDDNVPLGDVLTQSTDTLKVKREAKSEIIPNVKPISNPPEANIHERAPDISVNEVITLLKNELDKLNIPSVIENTQDIILPLITQLEALKPNETLKAKEILEKAENKAFITVGANYALDILHKTLETISISKEKSRNIKGA